MKFMNSYYIIFVAIFLIGYLYFVRSHTKRFFKWIEDHWFLKQSKKSKLAFFLHFIGVCLLTVALLDLRGKEEHVQGKVSHQKTIILIDSSASMLAEDVRPNRFEKGLLLIKHYVKKAIGQQISIVVFSDGQKRIVPFTDDIDLLLARVESLRKLKLERGGTGLSLAIQESIQYFRDSSKEISGNILIFTDAEETDGGIKLNVPDAVTVGVVGIGTAKGAPIPVRDRRGVFVGNKKFKGEVVISKLNEKYLSSLGSQIKNFKSWVATSYTLPTKDIIKFFTRIHDIKNSENSFRIRPVLANYLLVPGVILIAISFFLNIFRSFAPIALLFLLMGNNAYSQEEKPQEKKEKVKSEYIQKLEDRFVEGNLSDEGKKVLARQLLKEGFQKDADSLYEEILDSKVTDKNVLDKFNHSAAKLKNSKVKEGIDGYNDILDYLKKNPSKENDALKEHVKKNIAKAFRQNKGKSGSKGKKSKDKKDKDKKNKNKNQSKDDQKNDDQNKKNQQQKNNKDGQGKDKEDKKDKSDQGKDKENKDKQKDGKDKKQDSKPNNGKKKKKLPAILKQLMSGDDQLQKKMIDAKTTKRKSRDRKDW